MKMLSQKDMAKATRLTGEGRLDEAMALLHAVIRGSSTPAGASEPQAKRRSVLPPRGRKFVDMTPPSAGTGDSWTSPECAPADDVHGEESLLPPTESRYQADEKPLHALRDLFRPSERRTTVLPEGARFEERAFTNEAGSREYKLYIPSSFTGKPVPLIVMLHGCTQSPDDFAAGTRMNLLAEEFNFLVAYPAQSLSANSSKCWNWFRPGDQCRGQGEPSLIAGIAQQIMKDYPIVLPKIFVCGLSAGGAAAAVVGATYPDIFAAVGVHSGLACGAAKDVASAFNAMKKGETRPVGSPDRRDGKSSIPTIVFHGDRDTTVNPVNGYRVMAQAKAAANLQRSVSSGRSQGGINYTRIIEVDQSGRTVLEHWSLHGCGHAWSGGSTEGSYTDPRGPDASREMVRFFLQHRAPTAADAT